MKKLSATILAESGASPNMISYHLNHSSIGTANNYIRDSKRFQVEIAEKLKMPQSDNLIPKRETDDDTSKRYQINLQGATNVTLNFS